MRRIVYPFFLLLLTACVAASPQQALLDKARQGDGAAQLEMGHKFCDTHPGVYQADTTQAVSWWEKAAASKDKSIAAQANETLGIFYFGRYVSPPNNSSAESKPIALCRGDTPVQPDHDKAISYFKKCANGNALGLGMTCEMQLGLVYEDMKDYEKAYFWHATVLASGLQQDAKEDEWGLPVVDKLSLSDPRLKDVRGFAARAAKHLTAKKISALNARAQVYTQTYGPRWLKPEDRVYTK